MPYKDKEKQKAACATWFRNKYRTDEKLREYYRRYVLAYRAKKAIEEVQQINKQKAGAVQKQRFGYSGQLRPGGF